MEWKEVRLGDVCEIYGRIGFRGYTTNDLVDTPKEGAISLSPKNIINGELNLDQCTYIKWDKYYESPEIMINPNEIIITKTGSSVGRTTFVRRVDHPMTLNPQLVVLKNISENAEFLSYYIKSALFQSVLKSIVVGSAIPTLSQKNLANLKINVPKEVDDQRRIASILSSLDRKIELNNKINADLEEMAQAIFKNWFVDFEPFKDSKFVDSELGMIPEGWKVGTLGDITKNKSAKVKERNDVKVLSPVTTGELVLSEEYFTKQVFSSSIAKYKIVNKGDFAYNPARVNIGSLGRNDFDFDGCVSPVYVVFSVLDGYENYFDLFRKTDFFKDSVASLAIGGVRQSLSYDDLSSIEVIIPSENAVEEFNNLYNQMKKTIKANKLESSRLSLLRDTLLPRLMSCELEVPE